MIAAGLGFGRLPPCSTRAEPCTSENRQEEGVDAGPPAGASAPWTKAEQEPPDWCSSSCCSSPALRTAPWTRRSPNWRMLFSRRCDRSRRTETRMLRALVTRRSESRPRSLLCSGRPWSSTLDGEVFELTEPPESAHGWKHHGAGEVEHGGSSVGGPDAEGDWRPFRRRSWPRACAPCSVACRAPISTHGDGSLWSRSGSPTETPRGSERSVGSGARVSGRLRHRPRPPAGSRVAQSSPP